MDHNKDIRVMSFIAIIISVFCIGMSYISISTTHYITSGYFSSSFNWVIRFDNLKKAKLSGMAMENKAPIINGNTVIKDFNISFKNSNDKVTYEFEIVNDGDFDARLTTLTFNKPICSTSNSISYDILNKVCSNIDYTLETNGNVPIELGSIIAKKSRISVRLSIKYVDDIDTNADIIINNLGLVMVYSQN